MLSAPAAGHEVYIVTDASGGGSVEGQERAVQRMMQAGARPLTVPSYVSELQGDWAGRSRPTTSPICSPSWAADSDRGSVGSGSCWASR